MIHTVSLPKGMTYTEILELQLRDFNLRVDRRKNGEPPIDDIVYFAEHQPVLTLGLHGDMEHLVVSEDLLKYQGVEFVKINRGGDITYHGPGQLTAYPIIDLLKYHLGVKEYVNLLEQAVIDTIAEFGITGDRIEGKTGVWIGKGTDRERKISAIGIKCSRFVTMHGVALNVGSDLSGFRYIVPCGLPQGVTSISTETGHEVGVDEVLPIFRYHLICLLQLRIPSPEIS